MPESLLLWWSSLCTIAFLNVLAWLYSERRLRCQAAQFSDDELATRRMILWLGACYVLGCAFRSVFPMIDGPRWCLHDTVVSRVAVGRTVATFAEICFAAQWALLLREAGAVAANALVRRIAYVLVPMAVLAECLSWFAVLTRDNLFHAFENSVWMVGGALVLVACAAVRTAVDGTTRRVFDATVIGAAAYVAFMAIVDVPMYLGRWQADLAGGFTGQSATRGFAEIIVRCEVVRSLEAWRADVAWLTLYFSVVVWASIALAQVPPLRRRSAAVGGRSEILATERS